MWAGKPTHLLRASAKPQKSFVVLPTVLPVAQCFSFEDLHPNPSLYGFCASVKGFLCLKCFYKPKSMFSKSIFPVCKPAHCDVTLGPQDLVLLKEGKGLHTLSEYSSHHFPLFLNPFTEKKI